jgi:hypothetical protein
VGPASALALSLARLSVECIAGSTLGYPDGMSESDLSVLRRLADNGNDEAADRLTELAAARGDIEELQRLADEGNDKAAGLLSESIRNIK